MGHRINERNSGNWSVDGEPKKRRQSKNITDEEKEVAKQILMKVCQSLEHDKSLNGRGHLSPESLWVDGGRITLMITGAERDILYNLISKL